MKTLVIDIVVRKELFHTLWVYFNSGKSVL